MQFIYVVKRARITDLIPECGFTSLPRELCAERFGNGFFMERRTAETDPDFKQIIPYTVLWRQDEVFVFERLAGGGEKRLHNLLSIGVGGHMEPTETGDSWKMIQAAALRELSEEVALTTSSPLHLEYQGIINDESNEVGTVHTGVVFFARLEPEAMVTVRETDVLAGRFRPVSGLRDDPALRFETWSRHILDAL